MRRLTFFIALQVLGWVATYFCDDLIGPGLGLISAGGYVLGWPIMIGVQCVNGVLQAVFHRDILILEADGFWDWVAKGFFIAGIEFMGIYLAIRLIRRVMRPQRLNLGLT